MDRLYVDICHFNYFKFCGIKYSHDTMKPSPLYISRTFSSSQTEALYPWNNNFPFSLLPAPGNLYSTFCPYELAYLRYLM